MAEQGLERLQRRGTPTADAMQRMWQAERDSFELKKCALRTSIETVMAQNVQPTVGPRLKTCQ